MRLLIPVLLCFLTNALVAQKHARDSVTQDTVCIKLKSAIKMEMGQESEVMTVTNSCGQTLDIQIYKQNKNGHWFSSRFDALEPGGYVRTAVSLTGKYVVYKRIADSKAEFPSLEEITKKHGGPPNHR